MRRARGLQPCHSVTLQRNGSERGKARRGASKWASSEKQNSMSAQRNDSRRGVAKVREQERRGRGGGRKEGMLVLCRCSRCRGNPSAACVASAQQCASGSPDPASSKNKSKKTIKKIKHQDNDENFCAAWLDAGWAGFISKGQDTWTADEINSTFLVFFSIILRESSLSEFFLMFYWYKGNANTHKHSRSAKTYVGPCTRFWKGANTRQLSVAIRRIQNVQKLFRTKLAKKIHVTISCF